MDKLRRLSQPIAYLVVFGLLALSVHVPMAGAALIGTEAVVSGQHADQDRALVNDRLNRADVKQQLLASGVDPEQAAERVAALTDDEVRLLAQKMEQLPAGGDALGTAVFVFLVLLVTDILGFTDIFPFVKKQR